MGAEPDTKALVELADAIEARLAKTSALLAVLEATNTSTLSEDIAHEYVRTVKHQVEEARKMHAELWRRITPIAFKSPSS